MKQNIHSHALLVFLLFLISSRATFGRLIASKHGQKEVEVNEITNWVPIEIEETEGGNEVFNELMGMEDCNSAEEDCMNRRLISEAHLDYIYTQHHKP